jgi:hypothetical protein
MSVVRYMLGSCCCFYCNGPHNWAVSDPHLLYPAPIIVLQPDMSLCPIRIRIIWRIRFCTHRCYCRIRGRIILPYPNPFQSLQYVSWSAPNTPNKKFCYQVVKDFLNKAPIIDLEGWFFEIFCVVSLQSWRFCNLNLVCWIEIENKTINEILTADGVEIVDIFLAVFVRKN